MYDNVNIPCWTTANPSWVTKPENEEPEDHEPELKRWIKPAIYNDNEYIYHNYDVVKLGLVSYSGYWNHIKRLENERRGQ